MPVVNLIDSCYLELEGLKSEIKNQKQLREKPAKTTYSEVVCLLIKNYKESSKVSI